MLPTEITPESLLLIFPLWRVNTYIQNILPLVQISRFLISVTATFNICSPPLLFILYIKEKLLTDNKHLFLFRCANLLWTTTVAALGPSQSTTCSSLRNTSPVPSSHILGSRQEPRAASFHNTYVNSATTCPTRNTSQRRRRPWAY